jgi:hypothetical protein
MNEITNQSYYTALLPVILASPIVIYIALSLLWNRKWVPMQRRRGAVIKPFGLMLGDALRIGLKDDTLKFLPKVDNKITNKLFSLKAINWIAIIAVFALLAFKNGDAWIPLVFVILSVWIRSAPLLAQRKAVLQRMFAVASSVFRYGKGSELEPWKYVKIKKWASFTVPGETHVSIPATWDASSLMSREGFERHFNTTVTNDNSWIYIWKSADGIVVCQPISHLVTMAPYTGSEKYAWSEIPLGLGSQGEVTVDLTKTPHMLICGSTGSGKAGSLLTVVWTKAGRKLWGDLKVGDEVFGVDGDLAKVTHLHPIITPAKAYEITFKNGEKIIVDEEHLWETETRVARVSRFSNAKKEPERKRAHFLTSEKEALVRAELAITTGKDTISIAELAELTGKSASTGLFGDIAKEVGAAEIVNPKIKFHYDAQVVKQKQTLAHIEVNEFIELYNARRASQPSKKFPLTLNNVDKLKQLIEEVRPTDTITASSVIEYLGSNSIITKTWINKNFVPNSNPVEVAKALVAKSVGNFTPLPDKIFSIDDKEYVTIRDFAALLDIDSSVAKPVFHTIKSKSTTYFMREVELDLIVNEKVIERAYIPYNTYPKALLLQRLLVHNELVTYDQQNKREFRSIKETGELFNTLWSSNSQTHKNHTVRRTKALELPEAELPIAPYVFGAWLGDGYSHKGNICGEDHEIFDYIESLGYVPTLKSRAEEVHISSAKIHNPMFRQVSFPLLQKQLDGEFLLAPRHHRIRVDGEVKHIPTRFLLASEEQRRELLRGMLDTDGTVGAGGAVEFATSNEVLSRDAKALVASLGYIPYVRSKQPVYVNKEGKNTAKLAYTVSFQAPPEDRLFGLERKNRVHAERFTGENFVNSYSDAHLIVDIQEVTPVPMRCISVDSPDRLFLVSDSLIPTHNSVLQRNLIFHCIQHNDMWRFLGVDVKRVELTPFKRYTQTVLGIGANLEDGVDIVRYAKKVMESRYERMEEAGVNHFKDLIDPSTGKPHYAIMLMVDEAFMFMSPEGNKSDEGKVRDQLHAEGSSILGDIARLGRAAGIHLVLATQRPDATVIKGELKANLDIRIAAGRLDSTPSMMVLDSGAATMLPGDIKGRGIVRFGGEQQQFQGYYADQDWIDEWLEKHPGAEPEIYPLIANKADNVEEDLLGELATLGEGFNFENGEVSNEEDYTLAAPAAVTPTPVTPVVASVAQQAPVLPSAPTPVTTPALPSAPTVLPPTKPVGPLKVVQEELPIAALEAEDNEENSDDEVQRLIAELLGADDDDEVSPPPPVVKAPMPELPTPAIPKVSGAPKLPFPALPKLPPLPPRR